MLIGLFLWMTQLLGILVTVVLAAVTGYALILKGVSDEEKQGLSFGSLWRLVFRDALILLRIIPSNWFVNEPEMMRLKPKIVETQRKKAYRTPTDPELLGTARPGQNKHQGNAR